MEEKKSEEKSECNCKSNIPWGTITPISHFEQDKVICQYKGNCLDEGLCCGHCKNNTGKKSHYEPDIKPYQPPRPLYPCPYPYIGDPPIRRKPYCW